MYVAVNHNISDSQKWEEAVQNIMGMAQQGKLPSGLNAVMYLPSVDGRKAHCVWQADSQDALRKFLDGQTGAAARNEYFDIKADAAAGLPGK